MKNFYDCLTPEGQYIWRVLMGPGWQPHQEDKPIEVQAKLEPIEDIDFIMRQKPASKKELENEALLSG